MTLSRDLLNMAESPVLLPGDTRAPGKGVRAQLHAQHRVTNCLPQGILICIFPWKEPLCDTFYGSPNGMLLIFKRVVIKWDPQKSR